MSVVYLSEPNDAFSDLYLRVRKKEDRIFSDEFVAMLPELPKNHQHYIEWQLRKKSANRFIAYLKNKNKSLKILDVGCGNGWFSNAISAIKNTEVTGLDVNQTELEQADQVFHKANLKFVYADLFKNATLNDQRFDIITFNSCFQYFENAQTILDIARNMLAEKGEIHIIDTPFYSSDMIALAKQRTKNYYESLGFPEMAAHYFHHTFDALGKHTLLYKPSFLSKLLNDSPFCWIQVN